MTDPQKDEHIEELLSKLQGIFGKLSHTEEEESKSKIEIPRSAPKESVPQETTSPPAPVKPVVPTSINLYAEPSAKPPDSPSRPNLGPAPVAPPSASPSASTPANVYDSVVPLEDPEKMIVPTAVFFPAGRETEAKSLAQKLETMTPKFTKVAFRLRVGVFLLYDPKSEWKDTVVAKTAEANFQTAFVVMDRPMDDGKRKAVAAELEERNIYFQEVTLGSIEKKAFYTDILLGLVFFFDSRKPKPTEGGAS